MEDMIGIGLVGRIWRKIQAWFTKIKTVEMSKSEVAVFIEGFINHDDTRGPYDWDDFVSSPLADPELDRVRIICCELHDRYPPGEEGGWCSEEGFEIMRNLVKELKQSNSDSAEKQKP